MERSGVLEAAGDRERIRGTDPPGQEGGAAGGGAGEEARSRRLAVLVGGDRRAAGGRQLQRHAVLDQGYAQGVLPRDQQLRERHDQQEGARGLLRVRGRPGHRPDKQMPGHRVRLHDLGKLNAPRSKPK